MSDLQLPITPGIYETTSRGIAYVFSVSPILWGAAKKRTDSRWKAQDWGQTGRVDERELKVHDNDLMRRIGDLVVYHFELI